jgi:glycosyltransferase involved in cell wall biosynthesis
MDLSKSPLKISIIMPAFNEESMIQNAIQEVYQVFADCNAEVIIVDDGSKDNTYNLALDACGDYCADTVKVLHYPQNRGKGYALRYGFEHATGDLIVFLDADLDLPPRQIVKFYQTMESTQADVVIGCKYHPDSEIKYPWYRWIMSRGYYAMVHFLFDLPLRDTQTGLKLFRREVLERVFPRIRVSGFAFDLELLVASMRYGYRIAEAPVNMVFNSRPKLGGIGWKTVMRMWIDSLRIYYQASFWLWLHPALVTKFWMIAFLSGVILTSVGIASSITFVHIPEWLELISYFVTLKFIPRLWRNLFLISLGGNLTLFALVELNKNILKAFARADGGDLAGIIRVNLEQKTGSSYQLKDLEEELPGLVLDN